MNDDLSALLDPIDGIPQVQIRQLIEKEILYKTDGTYTFQVPITEKYLRAQVE